MLEPRKTLTGRCDSMLTLLSTESLGIVNYWSRRLMLIQRGPCEHCPYLLAIIEKKFFYSQHWHKYGSEMVHGALVRDFDAKNRTQEVFDEWYSIHGTSQTTHSSQVTQALSLTSHDRYDLKWTPITNGSWCEHMNNHGGVTSWNSRSMLSGNFWLQKKAFSVNVKWTISLPLMLVGTSALSDRTKLSSWVLSSAVSTTTTRGITTCDDESHLVVY